MGGEEGWVEGEEGAMKVGNERKKEGTNAK
jgi:hypothetical protein